MKLNKVIVAILGCMLLLNVAAANARFGDAQIMAEQEGYGEYDWMFGIGLPYLIITADITGGGLTLFAQADSNTVNANTFARAVRGDVVDGEYMASKGTYFAYAERDVPTSARSDYSIVLDVGESVILGFKADAYDYETPRYGWLELSVTNDKKLNILGSAWDLDGDPIVVGPTPEPTSGLLVLLGVAGLALRRKKEEGRME